MKHWLYKIIRSVMTSPDPYIDQSRNELVAYRFHDGVTTRLLPVVANEAVSLSDSIIQSAGYVRVDNEIFDLREDGLYRFYKLPSLMEQRIVCSDGVPSLLPMLGVMLAYGNRDDVLPTKDLVEVLKHRVPVISCGKQALVCREILKRFGIRSRLAGGITLGSWNGQDDGHTLLEVQDAEGKWFVYDPSFHRTFGKASLNDIMQNPNTFSHPQIMSGVPARGTFIHEGYDYGLWVDERLMSEQLLEDWYRRTFGAILIHDGERYCLPRSAIVGQDEARFASRYTILDDQNFMERFYPL